MTKNKKLIWFIVIDTLITGIVLYYFFNFKEDAMENVIKEEHQACHQDSDCIRIVTNCDCNCNQSVNKEFKNIYADKLKEKCKDCSAETSCGTNYEQSQGVRCMNSRGICTVEYE